MSIKIYHNPRCRKSREGLEIVKSANQDLEVVEYLKQPPTAKQLMEVVNMLGIKPQELVRRGEIEFKENYKNKDLTDQQWIEAMIKHPKLIERPIVICGNKAVIGRPPERIKEII